MCVLEGGNQSSPPELTELFPAYWSVLHCRRVVMWFARVYQCIHTEDPGCVSHS